MRPVTRGASPLGEDYENYRDAFGALVGRLGCYCSYRERRIPTLLAVEHIQPQRLAAYEHLAGRWENFLLACVNCNSSKKHKDVTLVNVFLPDRDNTAAAFDYTLDGRVVPANGLSPENIELAWDTLKLTGLEKPRNAVTDENGKLVAADRVGQRMEIWLTAQTIKDDLATNQTVEMRRLIVKTAQQCGHFSIWLKVFADDIEMRRMLIDGFEAAGQFYGFAGTASECFDLNTQVVSPRPANGLAHGSKI